MKKCVYCGAQSPDNVTECKSCSGREFHSICGNCSTVIESGNYCPMCGVRAGQTPDTCPRCGRQYYSNACPDCGYLPPYSASAVSSGSAKTRRTWLWVLGWIFIFPLPLTLLLWKRPMNKYAKWGIIAAAWLVYLAMGFGAQ